MEFVGANYFTVQSARGGVDEQDIMKGLNKCRSAIATSNEVLWNKQNFQIYKSEEAEVMNLMPKLISKLFQQKWTTKRRLARYI